jgi:hypothetical protein
VAKDRNITGFGAPEVEPFNADGERRVSGKRPAWFRKGARAPVHGFEPENRHQSKIYTESNQSHFWRIFDDLSVTQTLAIYRRLLAKNYDKNYSTRTLRRERLVKT